MSTPRRAYRSPRREQDAAATRNDIMAAATELFTAKGYARVTVADIAERAGVASKTVYASAGSKADILNELITAGVEGSRPDEAMVEIRATTDLAEAMRVLAHRTRTGNQTYQAALDILYAAMPVHDDAEALWEHGTASYRAVLRDVVAHLEGVGALADPTRAADVLWHCFGPQSWRALVRECGWTWDEAERWLATRSASLLAAQGA
ncbi:TetR/AcrR family transcriptional regulator [Umezawaea endophytica]|uniref:TetR/AcrR family transcriptional regulator n=1 Tax=Umezawaea endophytica TaxID=1654476 RepID=A0A9X3AET3_9PSEU|nr:TetR/AcrR family transcriptional regulator [Umezawaea endophytica]MCS7477301.1 TetR/AcrR family transcriptional regulator [Umezawaea endophytica]